MPLASSTQSQTAPPGPWCAHLWRGTGRDKAILDWPDTVLRLETRVSFSSSQCQQEEVSPAAVHGEGCTIRGYWREHVQVLGDAQGTDIPILSLLHLG